MDRDLIAYCGVDCSVCSDYTCGKCPGCKQTDWQEGDTCLPVDCCRKKQISFCGACSAFPCEDMAEFYRESETHEQAYLRMISVFREKEREE